VDQLRAGIGESESARVCALDDPKGPPINFIQNWQFGRRLFIRGRACDRKGSPILNLQPKQEWHPGNAELEARIASYELAERMQMEATDALDVSKETDATKASYGMNEERTASYIIRINPEAYYLKRIR